MDKSKKVSKRNYFRIKQFQSEIISGKTGEKSKEKRKEEILFSVFLKA